MLFGLRYVAIVVVCVAIVVVFVAIVVVCVGGGVVELRFCFVSCAYWDLFVCSVVVIVVCWFFIFFFFFFFFLFA